MYALNALYANAESYPFTEEDYEIARAMNRYWVNFVYSGNPNIGPDNKTDTGISHWYPNDGSSNYVMHLGDGFGNHTLCSEEQVEFIMDYFHQQTPF